MARLHAATLYWQYPDIPWMTTFPRLDERFKLVSSRDSLVPSIATLGDQPVRALAAALLDRREPARKMERCAAGRGADEGVDPARLRGIGGVGGRDGERGDARGSVHRALPASRDETTALAALAGTTGASDAFCFAAIASRRSHSKSFNTRCSLPRIAESLL